jgi:predicted GNAT family acetyltransferase
MKMKLTNYHSAQDFLAVTREALEAQEVVNSLMLGIAENLVGNPHFYGEADPYLVVVEADDRQLLRATMTPPFGLILSFDTPEIAEALKLVITDLQQRGLNIPDVSGPTPSSEQFAQAWAENTGGSFELEMAQRLYELRAVNPVQGVSGEMVVAVEVDIPLITKWMIGFQIDCFGELSVTEERIQQGVTRSVGAKAWHLWQVDGEPVSMALPTRPTRHGISVGGVYTPPEQRRHGYASACVAALSQKLLDQGYQFCSLFTDLANPTSNSIYMQIGYRPVADFDKYKLFLPSG